MTDYLVIATIPLKMEFTDEMLALGPLNLLVDEFLHRQGIEGFIVHNIEEIPLVKQ